MSVRCGRTRLANGLVIAAPHSGSGKTLVTLALLRALKRASVNVCSRKVGPDYIDPAFHRAASGRACLNLDPWAMRPELVSHLAQASGELMLVEGVMGLFDGALDGSGSTADLAVALGLPIVLVVDASKQSGSVGALVLGFDRFRKDVQIAGVIFNKVGSARHEKLLRAALEPLGIACLGAIHRHADLDLPSRHLGLVQAGEHSELEGFLNQAAELIAAQVDLEMLTAIASPVANAVAVEGLAPLGQRVGVARDGFFAFCYDHLIEGWRAQGAEILPFSPIADEPVPGDVDAIYLPGGYPELQVGLLSGAENFFASLRDAAARDVLIYGECGGYMVLGQAIIDGAGERHQMAGLLPQVTSMVERVRHLGYRVLRHQSRLPFAAELRGHEFHYSTQVEGEGETLFAARDALGEALPAMGLQLGNVMGSYAHIIDEAIA